VVSRLSQVARQARRSESTVSRVLNGHGRASPSTVTAVLTALDVLGFERPPSMRGEPRPRIVGLVLPDLRNPTFPAFADLLTVELLRHGLICALCTRTADGVSEAEHVEMLLAHDTAGIIFVGSSFADAGAKQGRALRQRRIPTVLINPADDNPTRARVSIDDAQAVRLALDHLVMLGHTRIGLMVGPLGHIPSARKAAAFGEFCRSDPRLTGTANLVASTIFSIEGGQTAMTGLLEHAVTAVVCGSDPLALGAVRAARRQGLHVPLDLSVVGFDDSRLMAVVDPPLTTIRQPVRHIALTAVEALVRQLDGAPPDPYEVLIDPELIVRVSTGPAPSKLRKERLAR
jgi:LacI family transcriptional regulator, repressor for deo operon, udp, cdd, tsx, nupC, and nupG